jgi:enoyl-CoA hydratase/carnithine racemase
MQERTVQTVADPPDGTVDLLEEGSVLVMRINRPAKRNGFTPEMGAELAAAYTRLEDTDHLRVGVVCAAGDHFTAGLDLPRWAELMKRGESMVPTHLVDPFDLREPRRLKPVVFAVQGFCYTLGIELMLAAEVVVAADNARFSQLEVKRGIMPTGGATVRIAQRAGMGNAYLAMLTGCEFDAPTALRWNLVQEVVPVNQLMDRAMALATIIAQQAPLAVREVVRNVRMAHEHGPWQAISEFAARQSVLASSKDAAEGVAAFKERRPAQFVGR